MKQQVSPALRNFLMTSSPGNFLIADCFTITLASGQVLRYTSFDRDVYIGGSQLNGTGVLFTSMADRLKRGALKNVRGVESSTLDLTVFPDAGDISNYGLPASGALTVSTPANGSTVSGTVTIGVTTTLSNNDDWFNQLSVDGVDTGLQDTGHYQQIVWNSTTVPNGNHVLTVVAHQIFTGTVMATASVLVNVANGAVQTLGQLSIIEALIAGLLYGASVKLETLYNPVRRSDGSFWDNGWGSLIKFVGKVGACSADRSAAHIQVVSNLHELEPYWPPFVFQPQCRWRLFDAGCRLQASAFAVNGVVRSGSTNLQINHSLHNPSGYFSGGRLIFTSGKNAGITVQIQTALGSGVNLDYPTTVLNDGPLAYYKLADGVGAGTAVDSSGNGHNATVHGGVTFGEASLLVGDTETGALFDGSSGYLMAPIPRPPKPNQGITFEFWYALSLSAGDGQPLGIYDTQPLTGAHALRQAGMPNDTNPCVQWVRDKPVVGFLPPLPNFPQHVVVVYRGKQSIDLYVNGQLYASETTAGEGVMAWAGGAGFPIGRAFNASGGFFYFAGRLQHFACYQYPFSPNQAAVHYAAGSTAPSSTGNGSFTLFRALPYTPAVGDTFTVYPGCDKTQRTCDTTFNNLENFGAAGPYTPQPEQGV